MDSTIFIAKTTEVLESIPGATAVGVIARSKAQRSQGHGGKKACHHLPPCLGELCERNSFEKFLTKARGTRRKSIFRKITTNHHE
jgi:hypothetical protein